MEDTSSRLKAAAFLTTLSGISIIGGFGAALASAKKQDPKMFVKGLVNSKQAIEPGSMLALKALGWGSLFAIGGVSSVCYGIWKLSGATDLKDFRLKMGQLLPTVPKNNPPQSRTEFENLTDLLQYIIDEDEKKKG